MLSFNAILLIWFQGFLREIENKCAAFATPTVTDLSLCLLLLLFLSPPEFFPGCFLKWKLTFHIPPEATRLQNTHVPINKYTKTYSHPGHKHIMHGDNVSLQPKKDERERSGNAVTLKLTFWSCHGEARVI